MVPQWRNLRFTAKLELENDVPIKLLTKEAEKLRRGGKGRSDGGGGEDGLMKKGAR